MTNEKINTDSITKLAAEFDAIENSHYRYSNDKTTKCIIKEIRDNLLFIKREKENENIINNGELLLHLIL